MKLATKSSMSSSSAPVTRFLRRTKVKTPMKRVYQPPFAMSCMSRSAKDVPAKALYMRKPQQMRRIGGKALGPVKHLV